MASIDIEGEALNARSLDIAGGDRDLAGKVKSNMGFFDGVTETASEIADTYRGTTRNRRLSDFGLKRFHGKKLSPVEEDEEFDLLIKESQFNQRVQSDERGLGEQAFHDLLSSFVNLGLGVVENPAAPLAGAGAGAAAGSVLPGAGTVIGATTGFGIGVSLAILKDTYDQSIGESYNGLLDTLKGNDAASEAKRKKIAQGVGLLTGVSMLFPFAGIAKKLPYFKKLASPKFVLGYAKKNPAMMNALEALGNFGFLGSVEAVQETLQQITSIMGQELGESWDGNETQFIDALLKTGGRYSEIAYAGGLGFVGGATLSAAGAGVSKTVGALRPKVTPATPLPDATALDPADLPPQPTEAAQQAAEGSSPPTELPGLPVEYTDPAPPKVSVAQQVVRKMKETFAFKEYIDDLSSKAKDLPTGQWVNDQFSKQGIDTMLLKKSDYDDFFKSKSSEEELDFLNHIPKTVSIDKGEKSGTYELDLSKAIEFIAKNPEFSEFVSQGFNNPSMNEMRKKNKNLSVTKVKGDKKLGSTPTFDNLELIAQEGFLLESLDPKQRVTGDKVEAFKGSEIDQNIDSFIEKKMGSDKDFIKALPQEERQRIFGYIEGEIPVDPWKTLAEFSDAKGPVQKYDRLLNFKRALLLERAGVRDSIYLSNKLQSFAKMFKAGKKIGVDPKFKAAIDSLFQLSLLTTKSKFKGENFQKILKDKDVTRYMDKALDGGVSSVLLGDNSIQIPPSQYVDKINEDILPPLRDLGLRINNLPEEIDHHDLVNALRRVSRLAKEFQRVRPLKKVLKRVAGAAIAERVSDVGKAALFQARNHPDFDKSKLDYVQDVKESENPIRALLRSLYNRMGLLRKLDQDVNGGFFQTQIESRLNGIGSFEGRGGLTGYESDRSKFQKILDEAKKKYGKGFARLGMTPVSQTTKNFLKNNVHLRHGNLVKKDILTMYMNMGNPENMRRVLNFGITEVEARQIVKRELGKKDLEFVKGFIWKFYKDNLPRLKQVYSETDGNELRIVEGDYYPLVYRESLEVRAFLDESFKKKKESEVRSPHTKDRAENVSRILDLDSFLGSMDDVIYDINMRVPLKETQTLLANSNFKNAMIGVLGIKDYQHISGSVEQLTRQSMVSNINYYNESLNFIEAVTGQLERAYVFGRVFLSQTAALLAGKTQLSAINQIGWFNSAYNGLPLMVSLLSNSTRKRLISKAKKIDPSYGKIGEGIDEWKSEIASEPRRLGRVIGYKFNGYDRQMLRLYDGFIKLASRYTFEIIDNSMKVMVIETAYRNFLSGRAPGFPLSKIKELPLETVEKQAEIYASSVSQHTTYRGGLGDKAPIQVHPFGKFISRFWNDSRADLLGSLHHGRKIKTQARNIKSGFKDGDYVKVANAFGSFMGLGAAFTTYMYMTSLFSEGVNALFTEHEPEEDNIFIRAFYNMIPDRLSQVPITRDQVWFLKTERSTVPILEGMTSVYRTAGVGYKYFPEYLDDLQNGLGLVEALPELTSKEWDALFVTMGAAMGGRPFPFRAFKKFGVLREKLEDGDFTGLSADKAATLAFLSDQLREGGSEAYNAFLIESAYRVLRTPSFHGDPVMPERLLDDDPMGPTGLKKPQSRADDDYFRNMTQQFEPEQFKNFEVVSALEEASLNYDDREPFISDFADKAVDGYVSSGSISTKFATQINGTVLWDPPSQAEIDDLLAESGVKRDPSMGELMASKLDVYSDTGSPEDKELKEAFREIIASPKNLSPKSIYDDVAGVSNLNFDIYDLRRKYMSNGKANVRYLNAHEGRTFDFMDRMFHVVGDAGDLTDAYPQIFSRTLRAFQKGNGSLTDIIKDFLGVDNLSDETAVRLFKKRDMLLSQLTNPTVFRNLEDAFGFSPTLKDKIQTMAGAFNLNETRRITYFDVPEGSRDKFLQVETALAQAFTKSGIEDVLRRFTGNRHLDSQSYVHFLNFMNPRVDFSITYSDNVLDGIKGDTNLSDIEDSLRQSSIPLTRHSVILSKMLGAKALIENPDLLSDKTLTLSDNLLPLLRPLLSNNSVRKYLDVNGFTNQGLKKLALRYARG